MQKINFILLCGLLFICMIGLSQADCDVNSKDAPIFKRTSCIQLQPGDINIFHGLVNTIADLVINGDFTMLGEDEEGAPVLDENFNKQCIGDKIDGYPRMKIHCDVPTNDIRFKYKGFWGLGGWHSEKLELNESKDGYRAIEKLDRICVQKNLFPGGSDLINMWVTLGCKYRTAPLTKEDYEDCIMNNSSCAVNTLENAKTMLPISATVINCLKGLLDSIFYNPCGNCRNFIAGENKFVSFQLAMRKTVRMLLVLYVISFGIKIALAKDNVGKKEWFLFALKLILVTYFAVGFYDSSSGKSCNYPYEDGITQFVLPAFTKVASSFVNIIYKAATAKNGLCQFTTADYPPGTKNLDLFVWDGLDCRIGFYLGLTDPNKWVSAVKSTILVFVLPFLGAIVGLPNLVFAVLSVIFAIFVISIALHLVHTYLIAMIAIVLVVYVGPIFIPLALFPQTKGHFDSWLRLLIGYSIQPAIIVMYAVMMFGVFDQIMYGNCKFDKVLNTGKTFAFIISNDSKNDESCTSSFGWLTASVGQGSSFKDIVKTGLIDINIFKPEIAWKLTLSLVQIVFFGFVFFNMGKILSGVIADITGVNALGEAALAPNYVIDKAIQLAKAIIDAYTGGAASQAEKAVSVVSRANNQKVSVVSKDNQEVNVQEGNSEDKNNEEKGEENDKDDGTEVRDTSTKTGGE